MVTGEPKPSVRPIDVARPITIAECALGMPPVDTRYSKSTAWVLTAARTSLIVCAAVQPRKLDQNHGCRKRFPGFQSAMTLAKAIVP